MDDDVGRVTRERAKHGIEVADVAGLLGDAFADRVWIGSRVTITRGGSIDDDSIIGANAVITRPVPAKLHRSRRSGPRGS